MSKTKEMTAEEYRQKMIDVFFKTGHEEFIALCVQPKEKEFEYLELLLRTNYNK